MLGFESSFIFYVLTYIQSAENESKIKFEAMETIAQEISATESSALMVIQVSKIVGELIEQIFQLVFTTGPLQPNLRLLWTMQAIMQVF